MLSVVIVVIVAILVFTGLSCILHRPSALNSASDCATAKDCAVCKDFDNDFGDVFVHVDTKVDVDVKVFLGSLKEEAPTAIV